MSELDEREIAEAYRVNETLDADRRRAIPREDGSVDAEPLRVLQGGRAPSRPAPPMPTRPREAA